MAARRRAATAPRADIVRTFPSLSAMVAAAKGVSAFDGERASRRESGDWHGSSSWDEALTLVHRWDDGVRDVDAMRVAIVNGEQKLRTRTIRRPTPPGRVDVAGVVAGNPRAGFIARKPVASTRHAKGRVVRVLVNISASSKVSPDAIKRRGAAVLALVDMLQNRGMRVEVLGTFTNVKSGVLEYRWTVKAANATASLATLAFGLAHPSMLRRIVFSMMECEPSQVRRAFNVYEGGTYGTPGDSQYAEDIKAQGGIYLPALTMDGVWSSDETAREWVRGEVERVMAGR